MLNPSVSLVKNWEVAYASELLKVEFGTAVFDEDYWKVTTVGGDVSHFYGETAWSDSQRYAGDLDRFAYWA
jgi:hypothetical protein